VNINRIFACENSKTSFAPGQKRSSSGEVHALPILFYVKFVMLTQASRADVPNLTRTVQGKS
jgi:hypothetical protein